MAESMVIAASMFESLTAWFTPTVLFCVTNLIIATIFIASNKHHDDQVHAEEDSNSLSRIVRVSSFLQRSRSMNLSSYAIVESHHQQSKPASYSSTSRLAQSIYSSSDYITTPLFERVKSFKFSSDSKEPDSPGELVRVPSFLDRVKSFKISSAFKSDPDSSTQTETVDSDPDPDHHVIQSKLEKKLPVEMKKCRSEVRMAAEEEEEVEVRRPATTRERRDEFDEEVDAKADDFISRFKQQLKLQRLESLVRYNDMLNRRTYK